MKSRKTTDEERAFFQAVLDGKVVIERPMKLKFTGEAARRGPAPVQPSGINGQTSEKLHRGDLRPEASLDLHGLTENAAFRALSHFVLTASRRGLHLLLVVTGKGTQRIDPYAPFDMELEMRSRGVLKAMVPRWLNEPPLVGLIADVRPAHGRHGGGGALYVYLRKRSAEMR